MREEAAGDIGGYTPALNEPRAEPMEFVAHHTQRISNAQTKPNLEKFGNGHKAKKKSKKSSGGLLSKIGKSKKDDDDDDIVFDSAVDNVEDRPAFSTQHNSSRKKGLRPREVAVPYSKLRKDRFFDWPPDPTVSRATPVEGPWTKKVEENIDSGASGSQDMEFSPNAQPIPGAKSGLSEELERLRRRFVAEQQLPLDGIPPQSIPEGISPW